jgi:hypothetical protein
MAAAQVYHPKKRLEKSFGAKLATTTNPLPLSMYQTTSV